jgi:hypothetical protein
MHNQDGLAYTYLYGFRRSVPPLAAFGSLIAWLIGWQGLAAGLLCVSIGELLETSYYINVLRWAERANRRPAGSSISCMSSWRPTA